MDTIRRFVSNLLGKITHWAATNPAEALVVFVALFVGLIVLFAAKKSLAK